MIRKDHYKRLQKGTGVDGSAMKSLKPSTVAAKGHSKILVDTEQMRNLEIKEATKSSQAVELHPGRIRKYKGTNVTMADVGGFHQSGTGPYTIVPRKKKFLRFKTKSGVVFTKKVNHPGLPQREWFGISEDAEKEAMKYMRFRIQQEINRA